MLVVLHRHGSIARPQHNGAAHLGILDILAVDTALRCATILHLRHVRNRGLEHGDGVARNVAFSASSDEVGAKAEPGPFGRHGAIGPEGAVRLADAGAKLDFTADGVEHEMTILRGAVDEVLGLRPLLPAIDAAHLEDGRGTSGDDRTVLEDEPLARNPLRRPEQLVLHQLGVHRLGGPAGGEGDEALDDRRRTVGRLVGFWLEHARPQPSGTLLLDDGDRVALRDMEHDVAVSVEAARAVSIDFARRPCEAIPGFPDQRRVLGIDAHALDVASEAQRHRARGHSLRQADHEHVIRFRHLVEAEERRFSVQRIGVVAHFFFAGEGGGKPRERARDDGQVADGGEDDRLVGLGA